MTLPPLLLAPSILSADFGQLNAEIKSIEPYADLIHIDVMDGHFVPNLTLGAPVVEKIKTNLPLDVHLMIENPERFLDDFQRAHASILTVHAEAVDNLAGLIQKIKNLKMRPGVSIKPNTSVETLFPILDQIDFVLIMSVEPGFGGQTFLPSALGKIETLRKMKPSLDIEVDGGINAETSALAKKAGANILVAGSYVFGATDRKTALENLRK
jgi:ribulose-phosphate 3-epimerase